jgi:hypothetical protein
MPSLHSPARCRVDRYAICAWPVCVFAGANCRIRQALAAKPTGQALGESSTSPPHQDQRDEPRSSQEGRCRSPPPDFLKATGTVFCTHIFVPAFPTRAYWKEQQAISSPNCVLAFEIQGLL